MYASICSVVTMQDRGQYGTMQTCLKTYENTGIIDREYGRERKHSNRIDDCPDLQ